MVLLTEQLLRSKAEHNEMCLDTLEEISLHQLELDRITLINTRCRDLKIIYMQNNNISKIEGLNRLKQLNYINLAVNKISRFEGLSRCEMLEKLDLTVNRIGVKGLLTIERLAHNELLTELYLIGNACCQLEGYRAFVAAVLPQLQKLDGEEIVRSERIRALQEIGEVRARLTQLATDAPDEEGWESYSDSEEEEEEAEAEKKKSTTIFDPATPRVASTPSGEPDAEGRVRQCNQGGWKFSMEDESDHVRLEVFISKYVDTSLIDADVRPRHVRVTIKGKVLQLMLPAEVSTDNAVCQRSKTTGSLVLTMPRVAPLQSGAGGSGAPGVLHAQAHSGAGSSGVLGSSALQDKKTRERGVRDTRSGVHQGEWKTIAAESPAERGSRAQIVAQVTSDLGDDDLPPM